MRSRSDRQATPGGAPPPVLRVARLPVLGPAPGDQAGERTRAEVFATLLSAGPCTRAEIAQRVGCSASTVTKAVAPLLAEHYLTEAPTASGKPGRPHRVLRVDAGRHLVVGVKVAAQQVTGVLTDLTAQVLARTQRTLTRRTPGDLLAAVGATVDGLLAAARAHPGPVLGVGVGLAGHVDPTTGICRFSGLLGWREVDVAGPLSTATGLPVVVNNDVNALALAERWFGAGRDVGSFAVVTTGLGVGCGLVLDGELYTGSRGMAGEFGHLPVEPDGPDCTCGSRGCLEALACDGAVLRDIRERGGPSCDRLDSAIALAHTDHEPAGAIARAAFARAGSALGRGIACLVNVLDPARIILSGEGMAAYDLVAPAVHDALRRHAFNGAADHCQLVVDAVNDDSWARGAACLVIHRAVAGGRTREAHPTPRG